MLAKMQGKELSVMRRSAMLLLTTALILSGCGGSADTPAPAPTNTPQVTPTPFPPATVTTSPSSLFDEAVTNWLSSSSYRAVGHFTSSQLPATIAGVFSADGNTASYTLTGGFTATVTGGETYVDDYSGARHQFVSTDFLGTREAQFITGIFSASRLHLVKEKRIDVIDDASPGLFHLALNNAERYTNLTETNTSLDVWIGNDAALGMVIKQVRLVLLNGTGIDIVYTAFNERIPTAP